MNKAGLLKIVNLFLFVTAAIQITTSMILFFHLLSDQIGAIVEIHEYNGMAFIVIALAHLMLNFGWVKSQLFKR